MSHAQDLTRVPRGPDAGRPASESAGDSAARGPLSFRRNFSWAFAGNVTFSACSWATLAALAKLGTPEMVGQYALGLAVTAPIVLLANMQLVNVQATDARHSYRFGEYLALRLIATVLALAAVAVVALLGGYRRETAVVILLVGLAKGAELLSEVFYGLFQQRERMDLVARSMTARGLGSVAAMAMAIGMTRQVVWGLAAMAAAWVAVLLAYDVPRGAALLAGSGPGESLRPLWGPGRLLSLARLALPLGLVLLVNALTANMPRYFLAHYQGERELGLFAAVASLMTVGTTFMSALWQSASPRLARDYQAGRGAAFWRLGLRLFLLGAVLGVAGILVAVVAGHKVLALMFRPEYATRNDVLVWVMVLAAVQYTGGILSIALNAMRVFWAQMPVQVVCLAATALLCAAWVPRYGPLGAIWAQLAAFSASRLGFAVILFRSRLSDGRREAEIPSRGGDPPASHAMRARP